MRVNMTPGQHLTAATLTEFPTKPTKADLLGSLLTALEDLGAVYDAVNRLDDELLLDAENLARLAQTAVRAAVLQQVFTSIAYLTQHKPEPEPASRLILPR